MFIIFLLVLNTLQLLNVHIIAKRSRWCPLKVCSRDRNVSKQRVRNVPLPSVDVRGGGRMRDEPTECLHRRLVLSLH